MQELQYRKGTRIDDTITDLKGKMQDLGYKMMCVGRARRSLATEFRGYADELHGLLIEMRRVNLPDAPWLRIREGEMRTLSNELRERAELDLSWGSELAEIADTCFDRAAADTVLAERAKNFHPLGVRFRWVECEEEVACR